MNTFNEALFASMPLSSFAACPTYSPFAGEVVGHNYWDNSIELYFEDAGTVRFDVRTCVPGWAN